MIGNILAPQKIYLKPGELVVADEPALVTTVLGSCIAVTLYSPRLQIGTICHAVLPTGKTSQPSRYVDQSVHFMLNYFRKQRVDIKELVAKMFGGAEMFTQVIPESRDRTVGAQNIRSALDSLSLAGMEPVALDVGGKQGRKLIFNTRTGEVFLKRLNREIFAEDLGKDLTR